MLSTTSVLNTRSKNGGKTTRKQKNLIFHALYLKHIPNSLFGTVAITIKDGSQAIFFI